MQTVSQSSSLTLFRPVFLFMEETCLATAQPCRQVCLSRVHNYLLTSVFRHRISTVVRAEVVTFTGSSFGINGSQSERSIRLNNFLAIIQPRDGLNIKRCGGLIGTQHLLVWAYTTRALLRESPQLSLILW